MACQALYGYKTTNPCFYVGTDPFGMPAFNPNTATPAEFDRQIQQVDKELLDLQVSKLFHRVSVRTVCGCGMHRKEGVERLLKRSVLLSVTCMRFHSWGSLQNCFVRNC